MNCEFSVIAEGSGDLFLSNVLGYMGSTCPENVLKWTAKPIIFATRYHVR